MNIGIKLPINGAKRWKYFLFLIKCIDKRSIFRIARTHKNLRKSNVYIFSFLKKTIRVIV